MAVEDYPKAKKEVLLEPIHRVSLVDAVEEQLKALILEGRLRPGDKIPPERELCAHLGVSRTAIREAKKALIGMGLLETRLGQGTFVRDDLLDAVTEPLDWGIWMERESVLELIEIRMIVETATAALAAERATDEDRKTLKQIIEQQQSALDNHDRDAFAKADLQWHLAVAQAAQNRVLLRVTQAVRSLLQVFIYAFLRRVPESAYSAIEAHKRILGAILDGDANRAREMMASHLAEVQRLIIEQREQG